jgi:arginyl-tRNA synthetase
MSDIEILLAGKIAEAIEALYGSKVEPAQLTFQETRKEFEGDCTIVVFPFTKLSRKSPEETAADIGTYLREHTSEVASFNVIKGFLNLVISDEFWITFFKEKQHEAAFGFAAPKEASVMVEYSSPNTNKPLHLGHIRNNLLGYSVAEILKANGYKVIRANLINDRGIHICKSMLAWQKWGQQETPQSSGIKGDHLVGKYYVLFDKEYRQQISSLMEQGLSEEAAKKEAPLIKEAQEMLVRWESSDPDTVQLWKTMNSWVYEGFEVTYKNLGVEFEKFYYESQTYLLGKEIVEEGLSKGVFYKKPDGSVWIDLTEEGLDHKLVLRSDGTSVYITQDLGTAQLRFDEFPIRNLVYVVGNEQDYHFKVLQLILKKLGRPWADGIYHLSYGMVDLPSGKMKSREGTVVDADELVEEMIQTAGTTTEQLGKTADFSREEALELYRKIGLAALKYFILRVDPKKRMLFNPEESIDFNGNTGPFLQYTYARIRSVLRKAEAGTGQGSPLRLEPREKELLKTLYRFPGVVEEAGAAYSPSLVANYAYELARVYNQFYHDLPILKEEGETLAFRLSLSAFVSRVLQRATALLGIEMPERM